MNVTPEKTVPLQAWHISTSLRLHFEGKFDAVKYKFRMPSLTEEALKVRKDRYHFEKLARRYPNPSDLIWFVTANILAGKKWVGSMIEEPYMDLRGYHESMKYKFSEELKPLQERFGTLDDGIMATQRIREISPPSILTAYMHDEISIHGIAIIQCLTSFLDYEMKNIPDPLGLYEEATRKVQKYSALLERELHKPTYRDIVIKLFQV